MVNHVSACFFTQALRFVLQYPSPSPSSTSQQNSRGSIRIEPDFIMGLVKATNFPSLVLRARHLPSGFRQSLFLSSDTARQWFDTQRRRLQHRQSIYSSRTLQYAT